jgi:hypothetical protein
MFALAEARVIQISPLFRQTYEDAVRRLCRDTPIREAPNSSEINNAQMERIPH